MVIYPSEIELGLEATIKANRTIAYSAQLTSISSLEKEFQSSASLSELLKLGIKDFNDSNLNYNKSILVSTGWNLNDDVFDKMEVWVARNSPKDKPSNLDHNEKWIVGHMTDVWAIDEVGDILKANVGENDLPDHYHLFTNNVIYLHWEDEEFKSKVVALVASINKGEKYVSMECVFNNFDYAFRDINGLNKVVARQADTAHLTKHLRAYGGSGVYKGMKIGRLLRNISFSGKGYVDKPANPESIIFSEKDFFSFAKANVVVENELIGVDNNTDINNGSDKMAVELETLKAELEKALAEKAELQAKLVKADTDKLAERVAELEAELTATKSELAEAKKGDEEKKNKWEEMKKNFDKTKSELDEALAKLNEFAATAAAAEKKAKMEKRKASLTGVGVSDDEAAKTVAEFECLSDEQFNFIVTLATRSSTIKKDDNTDAAKAALEKVKVEEPNLNVQGDKPEDDIVSTRAKLVEMIEKSFTSDKKKK